jgi:hypothetical protein
VSEVSSEEAAEEAEEEIGLTTWLFGGCYMAGKATKERPVIVCTEHRGVFFGYASDTAGDKFLLKRARMAIYFGTKRGVMELAETGPTSQSRISARADLDVRKVALVMEVTDAAAAAWEATP